MNSAPLIVMALQIEAAGQFEAEDVLYTGVGKVNAAHTLTRALSSDHGYTHIINLGTAGSASLIAGDCVCATHFIQRDIDVTALGCAPYTTPFADEPAQLNAGTPLPGYRAVTCGTGDRFETAHSDAPYDIVDMEGYALALCAQRLGMPFISLKYISDGADGVAADDWQSVLDHGARALYMAYRDIFRYIQE